MTGSIRRAPLVESICERLLQDHGGDDWLPPERELASSLGVSRPTLREAIKRLETQGLLASKHGVGVQVVDLPHTPVQAVLARVLPSPTERIRQFTAARRLIEPELAALAATRARAAELKQLRAAHERFMDPALPVAGTIEADLNFHRLIARAARNRVLALMIASMAPLEADARQATLLRVGLPVARRQHTAILEAILAGDGPSARSAMLGHLDSALISLAPASAR
ncbi:MAG: FadR/GntR family transcriptional regulator [Verrucomicrobiota bacterium]